MLRNAGTSEPRSATIGRGTRRRYLARRQGRDDEGDSREIKNPRTKLLGAEYRGIYPPSPHVDEVQLLGARREPSQGKLR
jgi:hypothetical protein